MHLQAAFLNFKNISGGSRNDALPMYIHLKNPKSRETAFLRGGSEYRADKAFTKEKTVQKTTDDG
jgi:hypothetical protein